MAPTGILAATNSSTQTPGNLILQAFTKAIGLIITLDDSFVEIVLLSIRVSGTALLIAIVAGLALVVILELYRFPGRNSLITLLNTFTGLPPVVVGLALYIFFSRSGPFGFMGLLYTPLAMILAQTILATPIVAALSHAAVNSSGPAVRMTAMCLGATPLQSVIAVIKDVRYAIVAAMATAFGRVVAEVGAVLIVGGNIAHHTRVMTTAIALEADKGDFELAIALGLVLLMLSFAVNSLFFIAQQRGTKR